MESINGEYSFEEQNKTLRKWIDLLLDMEKDFEVKTWESCEGVTLKISSFVKDYSKGEYAMDLIDFPIEVDIHRNGFVEFVLPEYVQDFIVKEHKKKK